MLAAATPAVREGRPARVRALGVAGGAAAAAIAWSIEVPVLGAAAAPPATPSARTRAGRPSRTAGVAAASMSSLLYPGAGRRRWPRACPGQP